MPSEDVLTLQVWFTDRSCPRCGCLLLTNGPLAWCSASPCDFGIAEKVRTHDLPPETPPMEYHVQSAVPDEGHPHGSRVGPGPASPAPHGVNLSIRHGLVILREGCPVGPVLVGRIEEMELAGRRFVVVTSPALEGVRAREVAISLEEIAGIEAMSEGEVADYWAGHNPATRAEREREFRREWQAAFDQAHGYRHQSHTQETPP